MARRRSRDQETGSIVRRLLAKRAVGSDEVDTHAIREHHQWPGSTSGRVLGDQVVEVRHLAGDVSDQLAKSTVHHVTATAVASQSIAAGGATVQWGDEASSPTEREGFDTFHEQLQAGAVGDIPIGLTGMLTGELSGEWASYRGCDTITVTLLRDGLAVGDPVTVDLGPVTSRFFDGTLPGRWNVRQGDSLRVELANGSGSAQTLTSARFVGDIIGTPAGTPGDYQTVVLADSPVGYWKLDETSGTAAADSTGNGWGMTYQNSPTLGVDGLMQDGSGATAVDFTPKERVVGADWAAFDFGGSEPFSVECWFNADYIPSDASDFRILVQKQDASAGDGWEMVLTDGVVKFAGAGGVSAAAAEGTTYHCVATVDPTAGETKLYLNGTLQDTGTYVDPGDSTVELSFAFDSAPDDWHVDGRLDEVAIYDRALAAAEVAEHYRVGTRAS